MLPYITLIKRIREKSVRAHLLIYSFIFFKLSIGLGLHEILIRINIRVKAMVRVWVRIEIFLT